MLMPSTPFATLFGCLPTRGLIVTIEDFIEKFAFAIEIEASSLKPNTRFKELPVWDSLNTLAIIAMADADYDIALTGRDIEDAHTVGDLWTVASAKAAVAK